jgi:hypothetical protein
VCKTNFPHPTRLDATEKFEKMKKSENSFACGFGPIAQIWSDLAGISPLTFPLGSL